jgi:hypothetical protein
MNKKIFITGCAKSGTTLLKRMFHSFNDTTVIKNETGIYGFNSVKFNGGFLVGKRRWDTLFSTSRLIKEDIKIQGDILKDLFVINIVRHPNSVIKSYRKDWDVDGGLDWVESINHYNKYKHLIDINIRYEDLIKTPNEIQKLIMEKTGLKKSHLFSDYPSFFPIKELEEVSSKENYKLRPIDINKLDIPEKQNTSISSGVINKLSKQFY